jgi:ribonuclease BN (tRNA processing enzyme)
MPLKESSELVLLGTGGGPKIWAARSQPASAILVNGDVYIIDAGDGITGQLAKSGIDTNSIKAVFITHNHSDHVADYGTLLLRTWQSGHKGPIDCFGPPPLKDMTNSYIDYMSWDINLRIQHEARPDFKTMINVFEIENNSHVYQDSNLKVDCIKVPHGEADPSYSYRFQIDGKVIVFSGDTSKSEALIDFSSGADILVHEVLNLEGVGAIIEKTYPGNEAFRSHIIEGHTTMSEVGEIASQAKVKTLVLNHFVPTGSPLLDKEEIWQNGVRKTFNGQIIVGTDLLRIPL